MAIATLLAKEVHAAGYHVARGALLAPRQAPGTSLEACTKICSDPYDTAGVTNVLVRSSCRKVALNVTDNYLFLSGARTRMSPAFARV